MHPPPSRAAEHAITLAVALSDGTMRTVLLDLDTKRFHALRTFDFHGR
jgi:Mrp family chromosome partitioning ATPase